MYQMVRGSLRRVYKIVPPTIRGALDALLRPERLTNVFGGPFNGQRERRNFVERLLRTGLVARIVETGCFRGDTTAWFASVARLPVVSIESSREFASFTRTRLLRYRNVDVRFGDSGCDLAAVLDEAPRTPTLLYLDAHWDIHLPLREELAAVAAARMPVVVVIDDFAVPDDAGYAFDDYGPAGTLRLEYVADLVTRHFAIFWPAVPSSRETGMRRGCCVLGRGEEIVAWLRSDVYLREEGRTWA